MRFEKEWNDSDCRGCTKCITSIKVEPCPWCDHQNTVKCYTCGQEDACNFEFKKS